MPRLRRDAALRFSHVRARLAAGRLEAVGLIAAMAVAAFARFHDLESRAGWGSDQGNQMLAIWNALHSGTIPSLGPLASTGTFHHGALFYDLMLPGAWLDGGGPTGVLVETALAGLLVVPMIWWVARSIGGSAAGLAAAALGATSAGLVLFSGFIWNPTPVEPGAALALLGAWQAWSSRNPRWLLAAAAGTAVAMQSHVAAGVIVLPMGMAFLALLWRGPTGQWRRIVLWGVAGMALIVATYVPFILHELSHDFADTRAMIAFVTGPGQQASIGPINRLVLGGVRIVAWPLIGWPLFWAEDPSYPVALGATLALTAGLVWRMAATVKPSVDGSNSERDGTWLVAGCLGAMVVALGLGVSNTSQMGPDVTEQYHIVADPFVIVAAGLVLGSLWRVRGRFRWIRLGGRAICLVALAAAVGNSAGEWTTGPNAWSWQVAQTAATRIEGQARGRPIALVAPRGGSTSGYEFPLVRDGASLVAPDRASVVVVLCDSRRSGSCGGRSEDASIAGLNIKSNLALLDRFPGLSSQLLSVYGVPGT